MLGQCSQSFLRPVVRLNLLLGGLMLVLALGACSSIGENAQDMSAISQLPDVDYAYRFRAHDILEISISSDPDSLQRVTVGDDGQVDLRHVGVVVAEGRLREELREEIRTKIAAKEIYLNPQVVVNIVESGQPANVVVLGAVARPQVVRYHKNLHVLEALAEAGGLTEAVGLARPVIVVRNPMTQPVVYRFDIEGSIDRSSSVPRLFPGDVVIAQGSALGDVQRWAAIGRDVSATYANAANGTDVTTNPNR